jgi:hypothetical protein
VPPFDSRRALLGAAKKLLDSDEAAPDPRDAPPRLTTSVLAQPPGAPGAPATPAVRMSRSRDKILENLDEMYREAFERARAAGDAGQMATLDFAYRREQLYFEILLDVRDAMERRA